MELVAVLHKSAQLNCKWVINVLEFLFDSLQNLTLSIFSNFFIKCIRNKELRVRSFIITISDSRQSFKSHSCRLSMTHLTFKIILSLTQFRDVKMSWSEKQPNSSVAKLSFWETVTQLVSGETIGLRCQTTFACSPVSTTTLTSTSLQSFRRSSKTCITFGSSTLQLCVQM